MLHLYIAFLGTQSVLHMERGDLKRLMWNHTGEKRVSWVCGKTLQCLYIVVVPCIL